ncbi:hypothetical protein WN943_005991 [Citrus x changshan-huyou]
MVSLLTGQRRVTFLVAKVIVLAVVGSLITAAEKEAVDPVWVLASGGVSGKRCEETIEKRVVEAANVAIRARLAAQSQQSEVKLVPGENKDESGEEDENEEERNI